MTGAPASFRLNYILLAQTIPFNLTGRSASLTVNGGGGTAIYGVGGRLVEGIFPHNGITMVYDVSFPWDIKQRTD
jgi:hypothetical protein